MKEKIKIAHQLRKEQTKGEKKLWGYLRNRQFENLKFRRQHPIKEYIVDFFSDEYGIVIELDGEYHNQPNQREKDELRDSQLTGLGFIVLRFENEMVFKDIDTVFENIKYAKQHQKKFAEQRKLHLEERKKNEAKPLSSRRANPTILSTKTLTNPQKSLALNAGLRLVEYNAISINPLNFELPKENVDALIFTSQNGVRSYVQHAQGHPTNGNKRLGSRVALCVGKKTKWLLEENGFHVMAMAQSAEELGKIIAEQYKNLRFHWLTGNQRRNELPEILKRKNVRFTELTVYETVANPRKIDTTFDGILFFSPSAVSSFIQKNSLSGTAFCIGKTTAEEVQKYTNRYFIANIPTIENVLVQAVKKLSPHT